MAVIAYFSAKGSPGCTTSAMLTSALWPRRALLLDADASGGDVGLRLAREDGRPLDLDRGLLSLLPLARRTLDPTALLDHSQLGAGGNEVVVGLGGPDQAVAAGPLWRNIAQACVDLTEHDVLLDLGRLTVRSSVLPMLQAADLAVCVVPANVSGVVHARERVHSLQSVVTGPNGLGPRIVFVVRSLDDDPGGRDLAGSMHALQSALPDVPVVAQLPHDPVGAGIFDGRPVTRPERTTLVRAGGEFVARLAAMVHPDGIVPAPTSGLPTGGSGGSAGPGATGTPDSADGSGRGRRRAPGRRRSRRDPNDPNDANDQTAPTNQNDQTRVETS